MTVKKQAKQGSYQKGKDKLQDVLDVAADLLIESGYHNFSMRKVADAAGSKPRFYRAKNGGHYRGPAAGHLAR